MKRKKLLKQGVCIAVCSTMLATGGTPLISAYQAQSLVFADEVQQSIKKTTYTADQLEVIWGNDCYERTDGVWKLTFNNQYDQVKWKLPDAVDMSTVKSVTFKVKDQKGSVSLKVYKSGDEDADPANTQYGLTGKEEYSISPQKREGDMVAVGLMTTDNAGSGSAISLVSVTVETDTTPQAPPEIEQNIKDWKESVTSNDALGKDAIAGTGIILDEIKDNTLMDLVEKHFNAVTFGNELKPDALFNYQLEKSVKTKTVQFDGQDLEVPMVNNAGDSLDFSRADAMVDKILEWNAAHPERKIRIRGHVLVWHSQTPEWFFHENYDISKPYVDKETMNRRLEWYISSVFDHYFGEAANKKYDGLFYGWDVVNEAVIGNTYRTDKVNPAESLDEIRHGNNSSWWHVYESNEFIINAFKYANKYAPENVELYYNDFGETDNIKSEGIIKLISDVKSAEGTRLDAFGMQAHYSVDSFSAAQFKTVAKKYAKAAGKVQLTELDFQSSAAYKSGASKESEYTKMAYCHKQLFDAAKDLKKNGTNVAGITVWGVIEPNSWLHEQSNVGGGADGSKQCPLLFDGKYKAKPAYWAYVDATKLEPLIQNIVVAEQKGDTMSGTEYSFSDDDTQAAFIPTWDKDGLNVLVSVKDATINDTDEVTVYVDETNSAGDVTPVKKTVKRSEAQAVDGGYRATIKVPMTDLKVAKTIGMDVKVMNNDKAVSFNDLKEMQETSSKYYAKATLKPGVEKVTKATVKIDGEADSEWDKAVAVPLTINLGAKVTADAKVLWDDENLYVYATVKDPVLNKDSGDAYQQDSLEVFIDENNAKTESYDDDDKQYRINYMNEHSFNGKKCLEENVQSVAKVTGDGYVIEAAFKWTDIQPKEGDRIGLEFQINDADNSGARIGTLSWNDETGMGWSKSSVYGTIELADEAKDEVSNENNKPGTDDPSIVNPGNQGTNNQSTGNTGNQGTNKPATDSTKYDVKQTAEGATISHNISETDKANAGIIVTNNKPDIADASLESVKADLKVNDVKDISVIDVFDVKAPANYDGNPIWITLDANYSADYSVLHFQDGKWVVLETRKSSDGKLQAKFTKFSPTAIVSTASKASTKPADAKKAAKTSDQSATAAFIVLFLAGVSMAGASRLGRSRKQS